MLAIFVRKHLTVMKKNKNLAEVIQIELRQSDKLVKDYRNTIFQEYIDLISDIIKKGQEQNLYRQDVLPGVAKRAFFGALDEVSRVWSASLETHYSLEEVIDQVISLFLFGVLTYPE